MKKTLMALFAITAFISCSKDNEYDLSNNGNTTCDTTAVSYSGSIATIMNANCNSCHSGGNPSAGIKTDSHNNLSNVSDALLLGVIRHENGYAPMPSNAPKLSDCDINKIAAWINQGRPNN